MPASGDVGASPTTRRFVEPTCVCNPADIPLTWRLEMIPSRSSISEVVVSNPSTQLHQRGAFIPAEFLDDVDVAECALDEQLEQLHRQYAAASRASSRSKFELELLEARDDIHAHVLAQAKRQRAA